MCSSEASGDKEKGLRRQLDERGVCRAGEAAVLADTEEDLTRGRAGALSSGSRRGFGGGREDGDERVSGEPTPHLVQHQHLEAAGLAERVTSPTVMTNDGVRV